MRIVTPAKQHKVRLKRHGFSLIELLIVILLVSLLGFLTFGSMRAAETKKKIATIAKLKNVFKGHETEDIELVCTNKCSHCFLIPSGGDKPQKIASDLKEIDAYILNRNNNPERLEFGRLDDQRICLRFHHYANGSSTQMILKSEEEYYFFPSYFGTVKAYSSAEEAADAWLENSELLRSRGDYY